MASRLPIDDNSNTKSEEGTIAFHKKRARRVSFAENTSVHIFDRDEDSGTPLDPKPPNSPSNDPASAERNNEPNQLFWNVEEDDNDNNNEDDDMDEPGSRSPFLRLVGSPSSGGSTIGSANSNDEDNFFGPVSASFIRRDLLDSAGSDGNHDQTMDSTAFSMHFRSIARSDSEVELKTSTGVHLSFEEKTPTQDSVPTKSGTSMLMTLAKKPNYQPSVSTSKLSTSSESNDMSIVGEYHHKYDYGELSPTLDALLAEGNKDLHVIAPSSGSIQKSPRNTETTKEDGSNFMDFSCDEDKEGNITRDMVNKVVSLEHNELDVANDGSKFSPSKQIALGVSPYASDAEISKSLSVNSSILATPIAMTKDLVKDAFQMKSSLDFSATSQDRNRKNTVYLDDVIGKEHKSPFVGSLNSLTDKPSRMLLHGASPSKSPLAVTPHNHASVFVRTNIPKHGGSVASMQKSISKLRMLEASPFSAALNAKLEDSTLRSVVSPSKMTPLYTLLEKTDKALLLNRMNDSMQSLSAAQKKRERASSTNMDDIGLETPKNGVPVTHMHNFVNIASPMLIPPESMWSKEKLQTDPLSSAEIRYAYKDNKSEVGLPQNFGYSPQKKLKIVNASEFKSSPLRDAKQFTKHNELVKFGPGHVAGSGEKENVTDASLSTTAADRTDALYIERLEKSSPIISTGEKMVDSREVFFNDVRFNLEMKENSTTLLEDVEREKFQRNFMGSEIARGEVKRASLVLHEGTDKQSGQKNLHDQFCQSPPSKTPYDVLHDDNVDSLMEENVPSPSPHRLSIGDVISERQTETEDGMVEKTARTHRSPKPVKGYVGPQLSSDDEISRHTLKHPTEINAMFSTEMSELLSQPVDKFSLHSIDRLADIVEQLLRSKMYRLLSEEIQSQKNVDAGKYIQHKRASEMKLVLCQFVHEKAKLQLMHVKRERLLRRVKSLASGISESEIYRLNIRPQQSPDAHCESLSVDMKDLQESQSDSDKVTSMGQAIDRIDGRIATLTKSFHKSCKIKGEPSSTDTITFVNNYLMKRACCQMIRKDLQLWAVDNLESRNGCHNVVLNYLNLMTQRFTVNAVPAPSISISQTLNNVNISKIFKDMDAFTAFRFVFNSEVTQKHVGATSLAQETQVAGSCLGNLLDVVTEIQQARIELKNLISTRFCTPLAEQLELELCFFDSKHRRKATVTLDTSCLRRGIYPSEIIPSQIDIAADEPQSSASLKIEITAALQDLKVGYLRIQQLCRCISKLISSPIR